MRDPQDKPAFAAMFNALGELYAREVSPALLRIYWTSLDRFTIDEVRDALNRHVANTEAGQFFPKPADILRMIEGTSTDVALRAWTQVDRAVRTVGPYASVAFDDPITHRVIADMGGWPKLCTRGDDREWPHVEREFCTRYRGFAARHDTPEHPPTLTGITEHENTARGLPHREPLRLLGNQERAARIAAGALIAIPAPQAPKFALQNESEVRT